MIMLKPSLSFFRILIIHDFMFLITVPIAIISLLVARSSFKLGIDIGLWTALTLILSCTIVVAINNYRRYRSARLFLEQGHKRIGTITQKTRSYLAYEYKHQGRIYRAGENLPFYVLNKFKIGQNVNILVNAQSPSHSLFYELYI